MMCLNLGLGIQKSDNSVYSSGPPPENSITLSAAELYIPVTEARPARATLDFVRLVDTVVALSTDNPAAEIITPQTILAGDLFVEFFVANPGGPAGNAVLSGTSDLVVNNTLTFELGE